MSVHVQSWVWDNSPYTGAALLIHVALSEWANDEGICWPSQATIAKRARCTDRYVRDTIKKMQRDGLLEIVKASNGYGSHVYRLVFQSSAPRNSATRPRNRTSGDPGNPPPKNHHRTTSKNQKGVCPKCGEAPGLHRWCDEGETE